MAHADPSAQLFAHSQLKYTQLALVVTALVKVRAFPQEPTELHFAAAKGGAGLVGPLVAAGLDPNSAPEDGDYSKVPRLKDWGRILSVWGEVGG